MAAPVVLADANVLYSAPIRDLLMEIATRRGIQLHWTDIIQDEWARALAKNRPDLEPGAIARTRAKMAEALPDARVVGFEGLIDGLNLPDPKDRHVLAAAIAAGASIILTFNMADFPPQGRDAGPVAVHPDNFLRLLALAAPAVVLAAAHEIMQRRKSEAPHYVETLAKAGLPRFAEELAGLLAE